MTRASELSIVTPPNDPMIVLYEFKCHKAKPLETYIHEALISQRVVETRELFCMPLDRLYEFVRDIVDADRQIIALGNDHIHATYTSVVFRGTATEARIAEIKAKEKVKSDAKAPSITNIRVAEVDLLDTFARKVISDWKLAHPEQMEFNWLIFQPTLLMALKVAKFPTSKYKAREWKTRIQLLW